MKEGGGWRSNLAGYCGTYKTQEISKKKKKKKKQDILAQEAAQYRYSVAQD